MHDINNKIKKLIKINIKIKDPYLQEDLLVLLLAEGPRESVPVSQRYLCQVNDCIHEAIYRGYKYRVRRSVT